jgi:hypothetical protein
VWGIHGDGDLGAVGLFCLCSSLHTGRGAVLLVRSRAMVAAGHDRGIDR